LQKQKQSLMSTHQHMPTLGHQNGIRAKAGLGVRSKVTHVKV